MTYLLKTSAMLLLALIAISCNKKYNIEGSSSISSLDGKKLYIKTLEKGEWHNLDSAEIVHGLFTMAGKTDSARMVMLYMDNNAILPMVIEPGNIHITLSNTEFSVKGTRLNDSLYNFIETRARFESDLEDLKKKEARMMMEGYDLSTIQHTISQEETRLIEAKKAHAKQFIVRNYDNILGPNVFIMLCSSMHYPIITPVIDEILQEAPESFTNNELVKDFVNTAQQNRQLIEEHKRMMQNMQ